MSKCLHVYCYHTASIIMLTSFRASFVWTHWHQRTHTAAFRYIENEYVQFANTAKHGANFSNAVTMFSFFSSYHHHFEVVFISWFGNWFEHTAQSIHIWRKGKSERARDQSCDCILCARTQRHTLEHGNISPMALEHHTRIGYLCTKVSKLSHANLNPSHPHH